MRYWVSWWSVEGPNETTPLDFRYHVTGARSSQGDFNFDEESYCAVIDAPSEDVVWAFVDRICPDGEHRFIELNFADWLPGHPGEHNRFPDARAYTLP